MDRVSPNSKSYNKKIIPKITEGQYLQEETNFNNIEYSNGNLSIRNVTQDIA